MNKISVREFGREPSKYLKELPIVLTQYGKSVATIIPITDKVSTNDNSVDRKVTTHSESAPKNVDKVYQVESLIEKRTPPRYHKECPQCGAFVHFSQTNEHYMQVHGDVGGA